MAGNLKKRLYQLLSCLSFGYIMTKSEILGVKIAPTPGLKKPKAHIYFTVGLIGFMVFLFIILGGLAK